MPSWRDANPSELSDLAPREAKEDKMLGESDQA